ncbi:hypothetical protein HK096_007957 [Nowakowskiella sp. JEL0078]|nr:hypothetical protein HK096_007957 [Nowakowskiella sp. JEL0078]
MDTLTLRPPELLLRIMGYLRPRELMIISGVCRILRYLAHEERFWIQNCLDVWEGKKHHPIELHWRSDFRHILHLLSDAELLRILSKRGLSSVISNPADVAFKLSNCTDPKILQNKSLMIQFLVGLYPKPKRPPTRAPQSLYHLRYNGNNFDIGDDYIDEYHIESDEDELNNQKLSSNYCYECLLPVNLGNNRSVLEYLAASYWTAVVDASRDIITVSELLELKWKYTAESFYGGHHERSTIVVFKPNGFRGPVNENERYPHLQTWEITKKHIQVSEFTPHVAKREVDWGWSFENTWVQYSSLAEDEYEEVFDDDGNSIGIYLIEQSSENNDDISDANSEDPTVIEEEALRP